MDRLDWWKWYDISDVVYDNNLYTVRDKTFLRFMICIESNYLLWFTEAMGLRLDCLTTVLSGSLHYYLQGKSRSRQVYIKFILVFSYAWMGWIYYSKCMYYWFDILFHRLLVWIYNLLKKIYLIIFYFLFQVSEPLSAIDWSYKVIKNSVRST